MERFTAFHPREVVDDLPRDFDKLIDALDHVGSLQFRWSTGDRQVKRAGVIVGTFAQHSFYDRQDIRIRNATIEVEVSFNILNLSFERVRVLFHVIASFFKEAWVLRKPTVSLHD